MQMLRYPKRCKLDLILLSLLKILKRSTAERWDLYDFLIES